MTMAAGARNRQLTGTEERKLLAKQWFEKHINMEELFTCAICRNSINVDHPLHCPTCSNLFCNNCIGRWLQRGVRKRCPCCQADVEDKSFVYCRVYQVVHQILDKLKSGLDELIRIANKPTRVCEIHRKELLLFCQSCCSCICVNCLLGSNHRDHMSQVLELNDAHQKFKAEIAAENTFLSNRWRALTKAEKLIALSERKIQDADRSLEKQLDLGFEQIMDRLRSKTGELVRQIEPRKKETHVQKGVIKTILQSSRKLANEDTCPEVVMRTYHIAQAIKKMHLQPLKSLQLPQPDYVNQLTPPIEELHFLIFGFTEKLILFGSTVSGEQCTDGFTLQLKGQRTRDVYGNPLVTLSLVVIEGYDVQDVKVTCYPSQEFSVEPLARVMDLKLNEDNVVLEFPDYEAMVGFLTPDSDELNLRIRLRLWATYFEKCAHKDWYIRKLAGARPVVGEQKKNAT